MRKLTIHHTIALIVSCWLFVLFFRVLTTVAQDSDSQGQFPASTIPAIPRHANNSGNGFLNLLMTKEVRSELKLDDVETRELDLFAKETMEAMPKFLETLRGTRDSRILGQLVSKHLESQHEIERKIGQIIDPIQMDRLVAIFIQHEGVRAIFYGPIAARIKLTRPQRAKLAEIASRKSLKNLVVAGDADSILERMEFLRKECDDEMTKVLTEEQTKLLEEMKGPRFEFNGQ